MSTLDLTTLVRLKAFGNITGDRDNATLSAMITSVSQGFEQYCSRGFLIATETERRILTGARFAVKARPPVLSVSSVRVAASGRAVDLAAWSLYEISPDGGSIMVWDTQRGSLVEVTYSGGIATDTDGVIANHPKLEEMCKLQAINLWQRHTSPDKRGLTLGSGDVQWEGAYGLLPDVKKGLDQQYNAAHRFL